jgi:hypothetical protein
MTPKSKSCRAQGRRHPSAATAAAAPGVRPGAERAVGGMASPGGSGAHAAANGAADGSEAGLAGVKDEPGLRRGDEGGALPDVVFDGGYRIPGNIYARLFDYQKTGARRPPAAHQLGPADAQLELA